jgi:hypothetical protein
MKPIRWQIERISRTSYHFIRLCCGEAFMRFVKGVRFGPIDGTVASRGMVIGEHVEVLALVWMIQNPTSHTKERHGIVTRAIPMVLRDHTVEEEQWSEKQVEREQRTMKMRGGRVKRRRRSGWRRPTCSFQSGNGFPSGPQASP